jgi:hypothetical protein
MFEWKCPVCNIRQRKEPHRRLSEHMAAAHSMKWSREHNRYITDDAIGQKINPASQAKHEREHLQPQSPKEPRYRRKPQNWQSIGGSDSHAMAFSVVGKALVGGHADTGFYAKLGKCVQYGEFAEHGLATLDEAKARVEAEIDRRLESVLQVVEWETDNGTM